ncbi:hypothetical protein [Beijerinckia indica]|uniref:Uncharacterized protein n=1 Tax=Beijerinckia indica subsp. indica (strain ATCC 9039 / DSM 1715 / NCIMB 8712) TaxID=395963 RepID=B2IHY3_BEII9|nr:hypothetical protein [Beijerinckia indica]ACB96026.1 conserved hypothetical protein [Beijerinckia indica subsp. indica ATCC 9039]
MKKITALLSGLTLVLSEPCLAQIENENLLQPLPRGYKIGFQQTQGKLTIQEAVPQNETVENWTEMVTTQIFLGWKDVDPNKFYLAMKQRWITSCKGGQVETAVETISNGYPVKTWVSRCPLNTGTGKPEITWFRAIKGNDSFYVIQKAFKFEPSAEQISTWTQYLDSILVCDTRLPERACPPIHKPPGIPL